MVNGALAAIGRAIAVTVSSSASGATTWLTSPLANGSYANQTPNAAVGVLLGAAGGTATLNNAGTIGAEKPITEITVEEWDHVLNTDLRGVFLNCKYLIPLITRGNPVGKVINISSELASKGRACYSPYTAAKGAVNTLTRSLALEYAPDLLVNAIAPGPIETDMIMADMEPEWIEKEKDIPLRRLGKVEEIGAAALLLASDDGNFICGQVFGVNGGAVFIQ